MGIAYRAYHRYLETAGVTEQTLPGFENVTPDQLFFINSVVFTCSTEKKSDVKSNLEVCKLTNIDGNDLNILQISILL